ncbi:MAG: efflux RND transporter permease subunit [Thermoanaerobaculia bacterium]|nr:efflux RND transporter permease subunit [Thermoanaerobaculia bacterium]
MKFVDSALNHRATVFFLIVAAVIGGLSAYVSLPRESFPDISVPMIMVYTRYPGAAPREVETQITDVLERELKGVDDLKELTSQSQESTSVVTVEFGTGIDIDSALQKVRDKVDLAKSEFPAEVEDPVLEEINFSDIPILQVNLAGDVGAVVLKDLAEDLQDVLESLPGVLRVNLVGGREREIQVDVDAERLRLTGLSLDDVVQAIRNENVSIPGGDLDVGDQTFAVRVPGEIEDPREIRDFVIKAKGGNPIYIRDVAEVTYGFKERSSFARINGRESVALAVQKRAGVNIIELADRVKEEVARVQESWPDGIEVSLLADQSKDIRRMVSDLENNILSGLVLVLLVLMFALGFRNATFVALAIPFSMFLTFMFIEFSGTTLNMVVLFALVLAVGMLVDNAVVVVENIYRHMQDGLSADEAASVGTQEVDTAILISTLTTVGAFFPLLFWPGTTGEFMSFMPMTLSMALIASLLVAFTVNPTLCATWMRVKPRDLHRAVRARSDEEEDDDSREERWTDRVGGIILERYRESLRWALDHRLLTLGATVGSFVLVLLLSGMFGHGVEFFPETEPPQIFVNVEAPPGTRLERTDEVLREIENLIADLPDIKTLAVGVGAGSQSDFGGSARGDASKGRLTLDLVDREERSQSSFLTMEQIRQRTAGIPGVVIDVARPDEGPATGDPVSIEISGEDFTTLGEIAERVRAIIEDIPGLVSLDDDFDPASPEVVARVDRAQAAKLGLTTHDIASTVRTAVNGTEASTFRRTGDDEVDIMVSLGKGKGTDLSELGRITVVNEDGVQIPLSAVATLERSHAVTLIRHKDQDRVVTVSGKVTDTRQAQPVREEAARRLAAETDLVPSGYSIHFGGQSDDEKEAADFLIKAFAYAVLIVLALMVGKFDSVAIPLIIITSVLMSMIGVLLGLLVTGLPFGIIMTGLGVISLAGVVVNNAIVLLDYAEQLRVQGLPRREVVELTGERRLRPVLLTAVTTILGLIPLGTGFEFDFHSLRFATGGESSQWWQGMAVAVIFGLAFATFLTLILVPVLYDLLLQFKEHRAARRGNGAAAGGRGTAGESSTGRRGASDDEEVDTAAAYIPPDPLEV